MKYLPPNYMHHSDAESAYIRLYQLCLLDSGSQKVYFNFKHLNNVAFILLIMLNQIKQTEPKTQYSHDELV